MSAEAQPGSTSPEPHAARSGLAPAALAAGAACLALVLAFAVLLAIGIPEENPAASWARLPGVVGYAASLPAAAVSGFALRRGTDRRLALLGLALAAAAFVLALAAFWQHCSASDAGCS